MKSIAYFQKKEKELIAKVEQEMNLRRSGGGQSLSRNYEGKSAGREKGTNRDTQSPFGYHVSRNLPDRRIPRLSNG